MPGKITTLNKGGGKGEKILTGRGSVGREAVRREEVAPRRGTPEMTVLNPSGPAALFGQEGARTDVRTKELIATSLESCRLEERILGLEPVRRGREGGSD